MVRFELAGRKHEGAGFVSNHTVVVMAYLSLPGSTSRQCTTYVACLSTVKKLFIQAGPRRATASASCTHVPCDEASHYSNDWADQVIKCIEQR